jgi:hypothetical protein
MKNPARLALLLLAFSASVAVINAKKEIKKAAPAFCKGYQQPYGAYGWLPLRFSSHRPPVSTMIQPAPEAPQ